MSKKLILPVIVSVLIITQGCSTSSPKKGSPSAADAPAASTSHQEGKFEVTPFIGSFEVKRAIFPNGLKLIVVEDHSSPTFAINTWYNVGSRHEVPGKTGLAHLFEHMMFKGTKNHADGQFDAILEAAGVEGENAFTSTDHTVYHQELPKEHLGLVLDLESDRMINLIVDEKSFKTEREVVQNERRFRKENSPEGELYQALFETVFTDHPYHWPVIGYEQDLNTMNAQDARDFYERFYSPERAILVIVGDVDANDVYRKVERAYGSFKAKNTPNPEVKFDADQTAQKRKKMPLRIENEKLWMAYRVPGQDSPDMAALEAFQAVLSDGRNSRLDRALVDSGISASVSSGAFGLKDPGMYVIMSDLQKGKSATVAESIILREIQRFKNTLIPDAELQRAKNLHRFHFLNRMTTSNGMARYLGDAETSYGNFQKGIDFEQRVQSVTPEMIQEVVKKYFNTQNLTVLTGTPKK